MSTNLKEQRMVAAHQLGMRDYREGREMLVPVYFDDDERTSYVGGYLGARRRAAEQEKRK